MKQGRWPAVGYCIILTCLFFTIALFIGMAEQKLWSTLSLIGTSIAFEAQPAALASIPLGFSPWSGALISIFANLIPIPLLILSLDYLIERFHWLRRKLKRAEKWSDKYGKYGVWCLVFLSPLLGAYVSIALGVVMRWRATLVILAVMIGMCISTFVIAFGGHGVARLI